MTNADPPGSLSPLEALPHTLLLRCGRDELGLD